MLEALAIRLIRRARGPAGTHRASAVRADRAVPGPVSALSLSRSAAPAGGAPGPGGGTHTNRSQSKYAR